MLCFLILKCIPTQGITYIIDSIAFGHRTNLTHELCRDNSRFADMCDAMVHYKVHGFNATFLFTASAHVVHSLSQQHCVALWSISD